VSDGEARDLEALRLERPIVCVPNGLDEHWWREAYVPPPEGGPWVFLGRLDVETKGLDLLLDGYERARRVCALPRLILVGPDHRGGAGWLRQRIGELGLTADVEVRPPVFGTAKVDLLKSASAVLHPSRWEALPFTVLEALAVGRPVLVTPGTNLASAVSGHEAGLAVDATVAGVSAGLCSLVDRGSTWHAAAGRRARALVQERFAWSRVGPEIAALYREIAA
jgi:glycosyltransferase involved in cell wall biosynthesis